MKRNDAAAGESAKPTMSQASIPNRKMIDNFINQPMPSHIAIPDGSSSDESQDAVISVKFYEHF